MYFYPYKIFLQIQRSKQGLKIPAFREQKRMDYNRSVTTFSSR